MLSASERAAAAYVMAPTWPRAKLIAESESGALLTDAALSELDGLAGSLDGDILQHVQQRREVLAHAIRAGVPAAFAASLELPSVEGAPPDPVGVLEQATSRVETQRLLDEQPVLRNVLEHLNNLRSALADLSEDLPRDERRHLLQVALVFAWKDWDSELWTLLVWDLAEVTLHGAATEPELQEGIEVATMALAAGSPPGDPRRIADLERSVAMAYGASHWGDRAENLDLAIVHLQRAAEGMREHGTRELAALAELELGRAWAERLNGKRQENFEHTVEHISAALEVYTEERFPIAWATAQAYIGVAYFRRQDQDWPTNLEIAKEHFDSALAVLSPEKSTEAWVFATLNSAAVYVHRTRGDRTTNLQEAIRRYQDAARIVTRATAPFDWAAIQHNLGLAWDRLPSGERAHNAGEATRCFEQALEVRTRDSSPAKRLDTLAALGHLHFRDGRWTDAFVAYAEALEAAENSVRFAGTLAGRRARLPQLALLSTRMAFALIELGRPEEAFTRLERGKTLLLSAERAVLDLGPGRVIPLERVDGAGPGPVELLAHVPRDGALVAPVVAAGGARAFVIASGSTGITADDVIPLPGLDTDVLQDLLLGTESRPGWLAYQQALAREETNVVEWGREVQAFLRRLWDLVMGPIDDRLRSLGLVHGARILLLPHGGLSVLPLHAASDGNRAFLDSFVVAQVPSLDALRPEFGQVTAPALVVADPTEHLRFAPLEAHAVAQLLGAGEPLHGSAASVDTVAQRARDAALLHFACHAQFDWADPLGSALRLWGSELLTWRHVVGELRLRNAPLATLSACETGISDVFEMPDEVISLAAGFLMSGACAVVSSLWAVDDAATTLLMQRFYAGMQHDDEKPAAALRAAQRWLRDASRADLESALRKVAESAPHIGEGPDGLSVGDAQDSRPCANPFYWAGWTVTGAP